MCHILWLSIASQEPARLGQSRATLIRALPILALVAVGAVVSRAGVASSKKAFADLSGGDTSLMVKAVNEYGESSGYSYHYPFLRGKDDPTVRGGGGGALCRPAVKGARGPRRGRDPVALRT